MSTISIPKDYGFVLMSGAFVSIIHLWAGSLAMGQRKAFKSESFLSKTEVKELQEEHKKITGKEINNLGYPDMGNGRYSALLPYDKWLALNNAQRAHYNTVEISAPFYASLLGAGLFQPITAALCGFSYGLGRVLYALGYTSKRGADGRLAGAIISELSLFVLMGMSFCHGGKVAGFFDYIKSFTLKK